MTPTLVIERPDLQAWRQRYGYAALTFVFWGLYLYLWQPLLSLVLWSLGLGLAYQEMLHRGGFRGLLDLLVFYVGIICAMSAVFLGWAWINYLRFRGADRRRAACTKDGYDAPGPGSAATTSLGGLWAVGPGLLGTLAPLLPERSEQRSPLPHRSPQ